MEKYLEKAKIILGKSKDIYNKAVKPVGIILAIILLIVIPFKVLPFIFSHGTNFVSTTLSSLVVSDDSTSTITSESAAKTDSIGTSTKIQPQKNYSGKSDLQTTLISTGIIDPVSKQYIATNYSGYNDEIAIKFEVKNIGTNVSGPWKLRINTPSRTTPYYDSTNQTSIKPGDKIVYTTSFNSPQTTGVNTAYITADPLNLVDEITEANNQIIVPIKIEGTYYNYNYNYNYGGNNPSVPSGTSYTWTNINVNCYANPQNAYINSPITWYAVVSGGNGYYSYSWSGTESLSSNQSTVSKEYYTSGTKIASVTVTANGQSVIKQCSAFVY